MLLADVAEPDVALRMLSVILWESEVPIMSDSMKGRSHPGPAGISGVETRWLDHYRAASTAGDNIAAVPQWLAQTKETPRGKSPSPPVPEGFSNPMFNTTTWKKQSPVQLPNLALNVDNSACYFVNPQFEAETET